MYSRFKDSVSRLMPKRKYGCSGGEGFAPELGQKRSIRLLSFNIQVGINTSSYRHYLTRSWQHVLPHRERAMNLHRIASIIHQYDVVALQEVDGGSLRSGFVNQVEFLAEAAGFPFWHQQLNRNLGKIAQHSNGLLSSYRPSGVMEHRLPGLIPGRGAIEVRYGEGRSALVLVVMHLALGASTQKRQLAYVRDLIAEYDHVVLMGDMNCHADFLLSCSPLKDSDLVPLPGVAHTFPSWRPERSLDHILMSSNLQVDHAGVLPFPISDHLPIGVEISLPGAANS